MALSSWEWILHTTRCTLHCNPCTLQSMHCAMHHWDMHMHTSSILHQGLLMFHLLLTCLELMSRSPHYCLEMATSPLL